MKIIFLCMLLFFWTELRAQNVLKYVTKDKHEFKYLRRSDGTEIMIVYFPDTKDYFNCKGKVAPRLRIESGDVLLTKPCDCEEIDGPIFSKMISQGEAESLLRNFDMNKISIKDSSIYNVIALGGSGEKIIAIKEDPILTFAANYIQNQRHYLPGEYPGNRYAAVSVPAYENIQFEFDSSVLKTSSYPVLDATSADLRISKRTVWVYGYASAGEGTTAHKLKLSEDRTNSVRTYLVNSGVNVEHIKTKGFGETHPIADNSTEDGRAINRRVEFKK